MVAAALAIARSRTGGSRLVDLVGDQPAVLGMASEPPTGVSAWLEVAGDAPPGALDRLAVEAGPGLVLLPRGEPVAPGEPGAGRRLAEALRGGVPTVVDAGLADHLVAAEVVEAATAVIAVVRPCYVALRRAVSHELLPLTTGVVVVEEAGRALRARDVDQVLDLPVLATLRAEARVARAVDAGTLLSRLPDSLWRGACRVLAAVDPVAGGSGAEDAAA